MALEPKDWIYFTEEEMRCKGTGECNMDEEFMRKLIRLREDYGKPMIVSSGYRDISYNTVIGGARNSAHIYGKAVDILCHSNNAFTLTRLAMMHGFTGIGVSQRGPVEKRFIHIDTMENSGETPRPTIWSYK